MKKYRIGMGLFIGIIIGMLIRIVIGIVAGTIPLTRFRVSGKNRTQSAYSLRDWNPKAKGVWEKESPRL